VKKDEDRIRTEQSELEKEHIALAKRKEDINEQAE